MAVLLVYDYRQLFGLTWKNSLRLAIKTGLAYIFMYLILFVLLVSVIVLIALATGTYSQ